MGRGGFDNGKKPGVKNFDLVRLQTIYKNIKLSLHVESENSLLPVTNKDAKGQCYENCARVSLSTVYKIG